MMKLTTDSIGLAIGSMIGLIFMTLLWFSLK